MNINKILEVAKGDGIVFLSYGGFLSQTLISALVDALEKETEDSNLNIGVANNISTIFIELSQNMMNYSKSKEINNRDVKSEGLLMVSKDDEGNYFINSQNIVAIEDKQKIELKLSEIKSLNRDSIKKRYRELRRSGRDAHPKGGGIGFYEIAKRSDKIDYEFKNINEDKYYFHFKSFVMINKENR